MGCCQTKRLQLTPTHHIYNRYICDLAARIAIDLISIYSDNTLSPLDIYMDEKQYLFGKRLINTITINNHKLQIPILRYSAYIVPKSPIMDVKQTPLDHLKEYLAMHNLLGFPVNIEFTIHESGSGYFDIQLRELI